MISLNLGILNLMPVPVLDGGHILIMALEGVARRDFSMAVKEKMLLAGFAVLMVLMVTVIYNDLTRISWIERFMPWRRPSPAGVTWRPGPCTVHGGKRSRNEAGTQVHHLRAEDFMIRKRPLALAAVLACCSAVPAFAQTTSGRHPAVAG